MKPGSSEVTVTEEQMLLRARESTAKELVLPSWPPPVVSPEPDGSASCNGNLLTPDDAHKNCTGNEKWGYIGFGQFGYTIVFMTKCKFRIFGIFQEPAHIENIGKCGNLRISSYFYQNSIFRR